MVVLIARFVAVLRSVVGFIAGANRMPFANFIIANSAGAVAWALFYGLGAYYLGKGRESDHHSLWRWPWSGPSWWSRWSSIGGARNRSSRLRPSGTFPGRCRRNSRERQMGNSAENLMLYRPSIALCYR